MSTTITLNDILQAWASKDSELPRLIVALAQASDRSPKKPAKKGAITFQEYYRSTRGWSWRRKSKEEQQHYRVERMKELEAQDADVPLPERLKIWEVLMDLWRENGPYERTCLLDVIAEVPLKWGPWRALKRIFKEAEARGDSEVYGALAARFDAAVQGHHDGEVTKRTLAYLRRRGWRTLRGQAAALPACYADAAVETLRAYQISSDAHWRGTWIAAHIWFHERGGYGRENFSIPHQIPSMLTQRAYPELWKRTPRPLFTLLERARSERVRQFAVDALKTDFRASLRDVEPSWVRRLISVRSASIDEFAVWLLENVPRFDQGSFRTLGLHEPVLSLLNSLAQKARAYAAAYARTHARDLPMERLIRLVDSDSEEVRKLAIDLIRDREPRKEVGLEAWGQLLETNHGHELAAESLRKHFGVNELTLDWFRERLLSQNKKVFEFASKLLPKVHAQLGADFFQGLCEDPRVNERSAYHVVAFVLEALAKLDVTSLDRDFLRRGLLNPMVGRNIREWIESGKLKPRELGTDFWKALAHKPDWEKDPWLKALRESGPAWARGKDFDDGLSSFAIEKLGDAREFAPSDLSFEWLMGLAQSTEERYHAFAVQTMIKAFTPSDFAPAEKNAAPEPAAAASKKADLEAKSFLFTGALATMKRAEAEEKVEANNGKNSGSVTAKLDYLVIGDEGSPLYGQGRKGSKQVAAEKLVAKGAAIKIISETAFLQMLSGQRRPTVSNDGVKAGCERLWEMATRGEETPLARFALEYLKHHHKDICLAATDRHVDPGAEIPDSFLTFDLVKPLLMGTSKTLRRFALDLARWELARWAPPMEDLVALCEAQHPDVFEFLSRALLADASAEHVRYRVDRSRLTPEAAYRFCESLDKDTRILGMELIRRDPKLADPAELFRLSESPDRQVQAFVIKTLWNLYRERGITLHWLPAAPTDPKKAEKDAEGFASYQKRPEQKPAAAVALRDFLRLVLFTVPPARLPKAAQRKDGPRLRPMPTRLAKLALIATLRDLALADADFAAVVRPLIEEFQASRGKSEHDACLVALTRLSKTHGAIIKAGA